MSDSRNEPPRRSRQARVGRLADDDPRDVPLPGEADHLFCAVLPGERDGLGAERPRVLEVLCDARAIGRGEAERRGGLDEGGDPVRVEAPCEAPGAADDERRRRARAHADEHSLGGCPRLLDAVLRSVAAHLRVDVLRRRTERELTEGDEVARRGRSACPPARPARRGRPCRPSAARGAPRSGDR